MPADTFPVAARDIGTLMLAGSVRSIGRLPLSIACVLKRVGFPDSVWVDIGCPPGSYKKLWAVAFPNSSVPPGCEVIPLKSSNEAEREQHRLVRLGLVGRNGAEMTSDGKYVLTQVSHRATDPEDKDP